MQFHMKTQHLVAALAAVAALALFPSPAHAYQLQRSFDQAESRAPDGRITVEASTVHIISCNAAGENGGQFYIFQYKNRPGFRAVLPPNWASPIGGRDFGSFEEAASAACASGRPTPPTPTGGAREEGVVFSGVTLKYYPRETAEQCQADCANTAECQATTWIAAGTYKPEDAAMCYLISSVTGRSYARGHVSMMKTSAASSAQPDSATGKGRAINDKVSVLYGDRWWPATILEREAGGKYKIHYDGWGSSWDEWVTRDRVRDRQPGE